MTTRTPAEIFHQQLKTKESDSGGQPATSPEIGGFLVCLNVPHGTEFGVDYESFRTREKFEGIKFLPLGLHFVFFLPKEHEHGMRQGFFIRIERNSQVLARQWNAANEELGAPPPDFNYQSLERTYDIVEKIVSHDDP
jgi:hypothetical protein